MKPTAGKKRSTKGKVRLAGSRKGGRAAEASVPIRDIPLETAAQVEEAAAQLYRDCLNRWGENCTAQQAQALADLLGTIKDSLLETRIAAIEDHLGIVRPGGAAEPKDPKIN